MAGPRFSAPWSSSLICAFPPNPFLGRREGARVVKTPGRRGSLRALLPAFQDLCWCVILRKHSWGAGRTPRWHPREPGSLQTHGGGRCPSQEESGPHPSTAPLPQREPRGGPRLQDTPRGGVGPFQRLGSELHPGGGEQQVPSGQETVLGAAGPREVLALTRLPWGGGRPAVRGVPAQVSGGGSRGAKVGRRGSRTRLTVGPGSQVSG